MKETFGQRFQRLRKSVGLTQEEIATKLNITAQAVSKWENDASAPDISVLLEIAELLHVSTDELLGKEPSTVLVPPENRKDLNSLMFHINILSADGDKVKVNIPLALAKVFLDSGSALPQINGKDVLSGIDFNQLFLLIEQGVIGKLVEIQSAAGDQVEIWVE